MIESNNRLQYLLHQYAIGRSSKTEEAELLILLNSTENEEIEPILLTILEETALAPDKDRRQRMLEKIFDPSLVKNTAEKVPVRKMTSFSWLKIAVAASFLLMVGVSGYFLFINNAVKKTDLVKNQIIPNDVKAPVRNKAIISFGNGTKIYLDSAVNGQLMQFKGVEIVKLGDGKIAYHGVAAESVTNTLTNPRGSQVIDMTLADGSRIWLNAGSTITYPVSFTGNKRTVSMTGEAYFEVAHNAAMPFIVNEGDIHTEVLGTHFNVNAYELQAATRITLLEGSVKVYNDKVSMLISPGQQAVAKNASLSLNKIIDMDEILAWKNGRFIFNSADIKDFLQQVSNWYDVDLVFEGKISDETFSGVLNRNGNLSQVISLLKVSGLNCKIDGKKLIVSE